MILTTNKESFVTKRGRTVKTASSFVDPLRVPRGGWRAKIVVNKVERVIKGDNARQIFTLVKNYLKMNDIRPSDRDIWFTLNHQWATSSEDSRLIVDRQSILDAVSTGEESDEYFPPEEWGSIEWKGLGLYLSLTEEEFDYDRFLSRVEDTLLLLNHIKTPHLGCQECYGEFSKEVSQLRAKTMDRDQSRKWLFNFHNEVNHRLNKPILTFEQAAKLNRWI